MHSRKLYALLITLVSCSCSAMLKQCGSDYIYTQGSQAHHIKRYDVHPFLRNMTQEQLRRYTDMGNRFKVVRLSDESYMVRPQGELKGGGPGTALAAYFGIQAVVLAASVACPFIAPVIIPAGQLIAGVTAASLAFTPTP